MKKLIVGSGIALASIAAPLSATPAAHTEDVGNKVTTGGKVVLTETAPNITVNKAKTSSRHKN